LVQDEIKRRRQLFDKVSARSAQLVEISNVSDANLTPIGNTTVKRTPVFPNLGLVLGGCGVLGLAIGALLAFIIEAMGRRVRCPEDLRNAIETPTIGVLLAISWIEAPRPKVEKAGRSRFGRKPKPVGGKVELAA
jgi:capsular polysaccharide biosynthesis protein